MHSTGMMCGWCGVDGGCGRWVWAAGVCAVVGACSAVVYLLARVRALSWPTDWRWLGTASAVAGIAGTVMTAIGLVVAVVAWRAPGAPAGGRRWRLVPVRTCRPVEVGVHVSIGAAGLPPYVSRDLVTLLGRLLRDAAARHRRGTSPH
jgi:hypothetical protein